MQSIPEKATHIVEEQLLQGDKDKSRTIFFVGSKDVGKSTLINAFLSKTEPPRKTLVLEYSFGRKSGAKQSIEKNICHIWEYGGKLELLNTSLLSIPIHGTFNYCVMLDLTKPKRLWTTIETCIDAMNKICLKLGVLPELVIIGGKYDLFKNYDTEVKKITCTTIRSIALLQNAHVIFYSSKEPILMKRIKEMLNNLGFGSSKPLKEKNINFMKPLCIPKNSDDWESIGISPSTFDEVKMTFLSRISPAIENISDSFATTAQKQAHPEPVIDTLTNLKYNELRNKDSLDISMDDYLQNIIK